MKKIDFIKDKKLYIILTVFLIITCEILLIPFKMSIFIKAYIGITPLIILIIVLTAEYYKKKAFYNKLMQNMEELKELDIPYPEYDAKNLFVRDDKKRNYYLITVKGDKRIDLKEFRRKNETRPLSFASENDLLDIMNLKPGSVTPLGLLNDKNNKVLFYIDKDFMKDKHIVGVHPNDNTATIWLKVEDLIEIIKEHGNKVNIEEF